MTIKKGILASCSLLFLDTIESKFQFGFDKKKILANKQAIEYLFGQLKALHGSSRKTNITIDDALTTYTGQIWTRNKTILMEFLHLGASPSIGVITPFKAKDNSTQLSSSLEPTLSPKDPNFAEWYKGYEAKMKKKSEGQEPFDD